MEKCNCHTCIMNRNKLKLMILYPPRIPTAKEELITNIICWGSLALIMLIPVIMIYFITNIR
jgi:hypothetical protein